VDDKQFADTVETLADQFRDRIPERYAKNIDTLTYVGEWGEALSELTALIKKHHISVTPAQLASLRVLHEHLNEPTDHLAELPLTSQPDTP
jgi:Family of unknown function (DUF6189)